MLCIKIDAKYFFLFFFIELIVGCLTKLKADS